VSGFIVFAPKFVESQFGITAAWAAQLIGALSSQQLVTHLCVRLPAFLGLSWSLAIKQVMLVLL